MEKTDIKVTPDIQALWRAWDIRNSKMVYDALQISEMNQLVTVNAEYFNSPFSFFDGCKWMEWIGLQDVQERNAYVGDIVIYEKLEWVICKGFHRVSADLSPAGIDGYAYGYYLENTNDKGDTVTHEPIEHGTMKESLIIGNIYEGIAKSV